MPTLVSVLANALGATDHGVSIAVRQQVNAMMSGPTMQAVQPIFGSPGPTILPDCITPIDSGRPVDEALARIRDVTPSQLEAGLMRCTNGNIPPEWDAPLRSPRRWVELYADAVGTAWQAFAPIWRRSAEQRARETQRIGVAVVAGALDALLTSIGTRARYGRETLYLPDSRPYQVDLADRDVLLLPLTSGAGASVFNLDEPDQVWIGYPLQATMAAQNGHDALNLLVGPLRGTILRALSQPTTMGRLARRVNANPSTLTYSCRQLESADLIARERIGREVRIVRTDRGEALLDLLSRPAS
jgi:DNA-binding HxlR family transcriptional regulator